MEWPPLSSPYVFTVFQWNLSTSFISSAKPRWIQGEKEHPEYSNFQVISPRPYDMCRVSVRLFIHLLTVAFFSCLLSYYVADLVETSHSDTRHWCAVSLCLWFCDFLSGGAVGARLFQIFNFYHLSYYMADWVETCRKILDVGTHSRSVSNFAILSQEVLWGRASWDIPIDSQPTVFISLSWDLVRWY